MKHMQDEHGAVLVLEIMLAAVVLAVVGLATYGATHTKKTATQTTTPSVFASPTSSSVPTAIPRPTPAKNVLVVKELGLEFTLSSNLTDLEYSYSRESDGTFLLFSSQSLANTGGSDCVSSNGPLGNVSVRTQAASNPGAGDNQAGTFVGHAGQYYLYYRHAQDACSASVTADNIQTQQSDELIPVLGTVKSAN